MSTLSVGDLQGLAVNSNVVTVPTGHKLEVTDAGGLTAPGHILQVVYGQTNTDVVISTNVFTDTSLSVSITPTSATSKVLVLVNQQGVYTNANNPDNSVDLKLLRDSTDLIVFAEGVLFTDTGLKQTGSVSCSYLDSPATTSATTYKTQFRNPNNTNAVYVQLPNQVSGTLNPPYSTIVAMEVSA